MAIFLVREWEPILPGVSWLYVRSPANQRSASGTGIPHRAGRFRPVGSPVLSLGSRSWKGMERFLIWGWKLLFPSVWWLYVRFSANQRPVGGAVVSAPCGAGSTREITVSVSKLSEQ